MAKLNIYRNFSFIDKDSSIDALRMIKDDLGFSNNRLSAITGISAGTIHNWFDGPTRCPQNATMTQYAAALGHVRRDELTKDGKVIVGYVRARGTKWDAEEEIAKQADWLLKQGRTKKRRAKKNGRSK